MQDLLPAGWFNLLGQISLTSSITFSMANHVVCMVLLSTGGSGEGFALSQGQVLAVYGGVTFKLSDHGLC